MTNPCCCTPSGPCPDGPCYEDQECAFCVAEPYPCPWGADALYAALVAHFGAAAYVDMGVINMRLAIPFEPFAWGCWDADETDTCCGRFSTCIAAPTNCTEYDQSKMRVECYSAYNSSQIGNTEFRAIQFYPNQFFTNCGLCPVPGGGFTSGYYTNGLPTDDAYWPRCDECSSRTPAECRFTGFPMPDIPFIDGNDPMTPVPVSPVLLKEPANTGQPCCDVVNVQCQNSVSPRRARFFSTDDGTGNPYVMTKYPGSPLPCESADFRDVYMAKALFLLPNVTGSGNCIRIVFTVRMYHFWQARLPGTLIPGLETPCTCNDQGLAYVGADCAGLADFAPHFSYGEAWYYLDLQGNETLVQALSKPLRKFWVLQNPPCNGIACAAEEGSVILNSYTGCECLPPPGENDGCANVADGPCSDGTGLYNDCTNYNVPEYLEQEVPCTTEDDGTFPHVVPNTHFSFPDRVFIT